MKKIGTIDEIPREGLRFTYRDGPFDEEGILLKLPGGGIRAYKNECRHLPMPLDDRDPGQLWDSDHRFLVCTSHGAMYRPDDGLCTAGPCRGSHLRVLPIVVDGDSVLLDTAKLGGFFDPA